MSYVNLNNPANFQLQEFEQLGFRYIVSGRPTISGETYRTIFVLTDAVVTATCPNGDSLSSETLVAGTVIHGFFEDVSVASGSLLAYKAGPITAQEIFDAYKAYVYAQGGIVEGESCAVADIAALLEDKLYSAASLVLIPSGYKVSHLYAERPLDSNGDLTFTRASSATRVNSSGLIEKVRTNLLLQSNSFDTTWFNTNSTETGGQSGYDGSSDAWLLDKNATQGRVTQSISQSGIQTLSVYAKKGTSEFLRMFVNGPNSSIYFNLNDGSVQSSTSIVSGKSTDVGGGWYRCEVAFNGTTTAVNIYPAESGSTAGTSGNILIQNAQLEAGDIATDYIPTTTTAVSVGPVANLPRIDYTGGGCGKLLLEPQRTNLNTYSEDISQAQYGKNRCTVSANGVVSPDGYTNADKIVQDPSNTAWGGLTQVYSPTGPATLSVFAKKIDNDYIAVLGHSAIPTAAWFNLANGTVGTTEANVTSASIVNYGNGWYRCSITAATVTRFNVLHASADGGTTAPVNSETALWGFQLEASAAYATSYIPTLGAAVTRGADACSKTGISSLIGQTEGTLFADMTKTSAEASERYLAIGDGTTNNRIMIISGTGGFIRGFLQVAGSIEFNFTSVVSAVGTHKIALAYANNDVAMYIDGVQVATDSSLTIPAVANLYVGTHETGLTERLNGGVNQALLFKTRLTNAQLAELTTL
jgi:hypothetical protein